jgi:hypothetical protein
MGILRQTKHRIGDVGFLDETGRKAQGGSWTFQQAQVCIQKHFLETPAMLLQTERWQGMPPALLAPADSIHGPLSL